MVRKIINICLLIMMSCLISGCGNSYSTEYELGIIYTTEYKDKSKISLMNQNLEEVNCLNYDYSSMSYDGFSNSLIVENRLYLLPKGHGDKLDYGKVVSLDLTDGKIEEYDFGRVNITDFEVDSEIIYASSNLNAKNYLDLCNVETMEIQTFELENVVIRNLVAKENRVFGTMIKLETEQIFLCEFNITEKTYKILYEIGNEDEPSFMEWYQGKLYFPQDDILYEYNIEKQLMNKIQLPHTNAYNLKLVKDTLYIGYTDIFNGKESYVDAMYLPEKKILQSLKYNGVILQMEISADDKLYILDYNKLNKFDISVQEPALSQCIELESSNDYYTGGFYLNKNKE